jgi:hypothetical protein
MGAKELGSKDLSIAEATKLVADFLEGAPLYTPLVIELSQAARLEDIAPHALPHWCPVCRSETTWTATGHLEYGSPKLRCAQCASSEIEIELRIEPAAFGEPHPAGMGGRPATRSRKWTLRKWGQWPAWSITPPREIQDALVADDLELYKKALVCVSQGYGIGALAYFRRVIENSMNAMLDLVEEAARADGDEDALRNVVRARESKRADEKLALIVEHVPRTLRPSGANPLAVLHDRYSRGLHAFSDDECVRIALDLRRAFDFVFRNLRQLAREAKEYADEMKTLASQTKQPGEK